MNKDESPTLINFNVSIYDSTNPQILKEYGNVKDTQVYRNNELEALVMPEDPVQN